MSRNKNPLELLQALTRFMQIIFEPKQHLLFAALWFLSLQGTFIATLGREEYWRFSWATLFGALTMFLVLFFLRAIDELKDFEYDKVNNPDRPLPSGVVSPRDIAIFCALSAAIVFLLNLPLHGIILAFLLVDMSYGVLLILLEKKIPAMQRSMILNLAITYPVSIALSFYTLLHSLLTQNIAFDSAKLLVILSYVLAFLHFEIMRKTVWPHLALSNERFYSQELGGSRAPILGFSSAALALIVLLSQTRPWAISGMGAYTGWLPCLAIIFAGWGLHRYFKNREKRLNPRPPALLFLITFYLANLIHALTVNYNTLR